MSLPGPTIEVARWGQVAALGAGLSVGPDDTAVPAQAGAGRSPSMSRDLAGLRAAVAATLNALSGRIEQALPQALAAAPQAWDRVDNLLSFFDPVLTAQVAQVRRRLAIAASATSESSSLRAVGIEGLLAIEAACGLARLYEQRLSSLIRLRVRSGDDELLPEGRPFLDVAAALKEAARAWA